MILQGIRESDGYTEQLGYIVPVHELDTPDIEHFNILFQTNSLGPFETPGKATVFCRMNHIHLTDDQQYWHDFNNGWYGIDK